MKIVRITLACLGILWLSMGLSQSKENSSISWLVGTWEKTIDEDQAPPDKITFKADGTWISYGPDNQQRISQFHVSGGDVYLTIEMQGKGPVALVLRPSKDRTKLVFTSPKTLKNATYEKISSDGKR